MRVNAKSGPLDMSGLGQEPIVAKPLPPDLNGARALDHALGQVPDIRTQEVARAKTLLADPAYPPPTVLREVAARLSRQLREEEP
jgi:hypothetical protein